MKVAKVIQLVVGMVKNTTLVCILSVCFSMQAQAVSFWEEEQPEVINAELANPVDTPAVLDKAMEQPQVVTPAVGESEQTVAKHIEPGNQAKLPPVKPKPAPKPMVLPHDPSIRIRPAANNPTINKNLRVSLQSNYMKEADRWYTSGADVNGLDPQGRSLLYLAVQRHHTQGIEFLLLRRADVNKENQNGGNALQMAVKTGQHRVVQMLLERGARITPMDNGDTMIHYSLIKGYSPIAMDLLEKGGVDVNKTYARGKTLLHIAAARNMLNPAQALLNSGANVNAVDAEGASPLHEAAAMGHKRMASLLISRNANVKSETAKKWRAIHHAARFGHSDVVTLLLSKGASANDRTASGKTPLALARHLQHQSVIDILASRTSGRSSGSSSGWFW